MENRIEESMGLRRLVATLVLVFAGICVLLATTGLNGVVSQWVGERAPEIGIRMALGAQPSEILRHFLAKGLAWGGLGLLIGLVAASYTQSWVASLLYGVEPFDTATFAAASACVIAVVLAAVWLPAHRASRIDPQTVLRYE
jgi:ABC-type antimicrobial peptide transport system permease subunit